ncbi:PREDICTED: TMV resistance protein N-like [Prunus mume]|uniref:TMV resistance protein N-like n=1 Tax=Prunus mume TaxID=102107 RepID=A0ABM0PVD1_PRUMU|nr:PREDICTED: TMV resistance protein N-like [Prunus mume]
MTTQPVFSSSFTSSSSSPYDVFLSFRGEDTRTNFTDHLRNALVGKGIHTFIDDDELPRGEEIAPALIKAIEDSRISLIVFSENYASSRWCLDELVEILRCKQSKQQIVWPIFYRVNPSHVRNQTNKFGDAFNGLIESKFKDNEKKVLIWREALTKAANLSGHPFKDEEHEATFINNIVDGILSQGLSRTYLNVAKYPVGIQSRVQDVERLLDVDGNGRRMVGIWGASGIGKTTIAKAIWNEIAHKFEGSCFLPNVREGSLIQLQENLLNKILGKILKIGNVDEGFGVIMKRLRHKKILLILDDVDELEQLDNLAGDDWFGEGSRVIITTKDRGLLDNREIELIYEVKKLYYNQPLELFSWHAFGRSEPPKDYLELAQRAIAFADGLPLALTILGSHLHNRGIQRWQVILDGYKGEPYTHIERILRKSYDALDDCAKEFFLDIACFFKGEYRDYVLQIVPKKFIEEFVDKAMITIEWDDKILMHELLANLGKDIVHKESPNDPGQRSRLWFYEDVKQVLTESTGTRKIKGIMVKLPEPAEITLNPECFRNMVNLEIFINDNASLCGHINYLPNALRLIDWDRCQLQSLPPNFQGNSLVEFSMPRSHIRQLDGFNFKHLSKLTSMNLRGCQFLEKIPNLSGIPNIKYLNLRECTLLFEVDGSIGFLDQLVQLDLGGCFNLTRFATTLRLKSLEELDLRDCKRLESFPEIEVEMESLWSLDISGSGVRELPSSIAYLTGLSHFRADYCENLTYQKVNSQVSSSNSELPLFPNLSKSDFLLPLDCWYTLTELDLSRNNFVNLPICFSKFVNLQNLDLSDCKSLLEIPEQVLPPRVISVLLDNCTSLEKIPKLAWVLLDNCTSLEKIPKLSLGDDDIRLSLTNCVRLCSYDITENIFLNQVSVSHLHSDFDIKLPGDEVPKWFSCRKDATIVSHYLISSIGTKRCTAGCEVSFEIPPNLKWETLRLVLCVVIGGIAKILVNGKLVNERHLGLLESSHVYLTSIPLLDGYKCEEPLTKQGNMCQVILDLSGKVPTPVKIPCGVHLLGHQVADVSETDVVDHGPTQWWLPDAMAVDDDDMKLDGIHDDQHQDYKLLSLLPLASKTSLGKRPRGSYFMALDDDHRANVVDVGDHEAQWLTLFTGPANHPKRTHIDLSEEPEQ